MKAYQRSLIVAAIGSSAFLASAGQPAMATDTTFGGFGYGFKCDTALTGLVFGGHSGLLPSTGGARCASVLEGHVDGVLATKLLHGSVNGSHGRVYAMAGASSVHAFVGLPYSLDCGLATAEARISATGSNARCSIVNLRLGGVPITVTGAANQRVSIPGLCTLMINEQKLVIVGTSKKLRCNALRLTVVGVGEIVISAAECNMNWVADNTGPCYDLVSGCGRLAGDDGTVLDVSLSVGINPNHAFVVSKARVLGVNTNLRVVIDTCSQYLKITGGRHLEGDCLINGVPGHYILECVDGGDAQGSDLVRLHLSNGFACSGHLFDGNLKLFLPCGTLAASL